MFNEQKSLITTPIYYVNDKPHIGHFYTTVLADVRAKYERLKGIDAFLLTGTDEHGKKIERAAQMRNKTPQAFADEVSKHFVALWDKSNISPDKFIRTTDDYHKQGVQKAFEIMYEKGDIYKGHYKGDYCVGCENYVPESQIIDECCCPDCGRPTEVVNEESYYFRLSNYTDKLLAWYEQNSDAILPRSKRKEVLNLIANHKGDLSISRTSFTWGIKLPDSIDDPKHIMYVWLDALFNYATGLGYGNDKKDNMEFFENTTHVIGKDILKFHTLYWPAFLMSVDLPLPKHIAIHGWWTRNGERISKTRGNSINPIEVIDAYGVETFRYFMLREVPFGGDGDFSQKAFIDRINSELAGGLGNLVNRMIGLSRKYFDYQVEGTNLHKYYQNEWDEVNHLLEGVDKHYQEFTFHKLLEQLWKPLALADKLIQSRIIDNKEKEKEKMMATIALVANILAKVSILLSPIMPKSCTKIADLLGFEIGTESYEKYIREDKLLAPVTLSKIEGIFPREEGIKVAEPKVEVMEEEAKNISYTEFTNTSLRVGKVVDAKEVKESSKLLQLQVDIGEEKPRQIIAGIKKYYSADEMLGKQVCIVENLEPMSIMGLESQGMLLVANEKKKLTLISPNEDVSVGAVVS